jgi:hypothetical protein
MCSAASAAKLLAGRSALSGPLLVVKVGVLDSWHDVLDDEVRHRRQRSVAQLVEQICPGGHIVSLSKQTSEGDAGPRLGIEPTDRNHVVAAQQLLDVLSDDALSFRSAQDKPRRSSGQVDEEAQTGTNHPDFFPRRWRLFGRTLRLGELSLTGQERTPNAATERHDRTLVNSGTCMPTCWAWRRRAGHRTARGNSPSLREILQQLPFPFQGDQFPKNLGMAQQTVFCHEMPAREVLHTPDGKVVSSSNSSDCGLILVVIDCGSVLPLIVPDQLIAVGLGELGRIRSNRRQVRSGPTVEIRGA